MPEPFRSWPGYRRPSKPFSGWQATLSAITLGVLAASVYRILPPAPVPARFSVAAVVGVWKFAGGMLGITVLVLLLTQVDKILLSRLLLLEDFGYYTLAAPIAEVEILNPYNEREFLDDKLSIVDVKARDLAGRLYQIEIQLLNVPNLPARILYGWADLYSAQLQDGDSSSAPIPVVEIPLLGKEGWRAAPGWFDRSDSITQIGSLYDLLKPTYAIWLLGQTLRPRMTEAIHRFRLRDEQGRSLVDHGGIWLLELSKCEIRLVRTELERWLKFFIEGEQLDAEHLPEWMATEEMQQAMNTLRQFSEKERNYHLYQARQNYLRQQLSIQNHLEALRAEVEQTRAEKEQVQAEKERERVEKEAALAEIERLKALLRN